MKARKALGFAALVTLATLLPRCGDDDSCDSLCADLADLCGFEASGAEECSTQCAAQRAESPQAFSAAKSCLQAAATCGDFTECSGVELGDEESRSGGSGTGGGGSSSECSSSASCGSRKVCRSGRCVSVECTSDSHCSGCRRCSVNRCVSCGSGPYGCYC